MSLDELKIGYFYSNGAYGRTWGVRQLADIAADAETGETVVRFKGIAGTCRRKKGDCSPEEFARWAKYQVVLQENDWKRVDSDASSPAEPLEP
ncbi:hypothetical protein [Thiobacillus denitrificans]|jgi:hypothetical protein|uniref:hypothetical protein n=1 Tax=Thiobacillus denitrificans TaxID=36861 RepID=UPI00035F7AE3|nr:hypothetical protein [Thiobacillus denitrificans]